MIILKAIRTEFKIKVSAHYCKLQFLVFVLSYCHLIKSFWILGAIFFLLSICFCYKPVLVILLQYVFTVSRSFSCHLCRICSGCILYFVSYSLYILHFCYILRMIESDNFVFVCFIELDLIVLVKVNFLEERPVTTRL